MQVLKRGVLLLLLVTLVSVTGSAQSLKNFTHERYAYLEEIKALFNNSASKDRVKQGEGLMEVFEPLWLSAKVSEPLREAIYHTSDLMLKKRMRAYPDFKNYLFSIIGFITTDQPEESFTAWQLAVDKLIEGKSRKSFGDFLTFSDNLFIDNTIFKSASTVWKADNSNYQFDIVGDEPIVIFPALNLICLAKGDSSIIRNTRGIYFPIQHSWEGKDGIVDWSRAGFSKTGVYAELKDYKVNTKSPQFIADSVLFHNSFYFDKPLVGKLYDKVLANVVPEKASYPRFESYNKRIRINNIFENVDYEGGFSQYGSKFVGRASDESYSYVIVKRDDKPFLRAKAKVFSIKTDRITADPTTISIYMEDDSLYHPGLSFKYFESKRELNLIRGDKGLSQSPFFNSYHKIDMYFETLKWNIDETKIDMEPLTGSSDRSANFESDNFFKIQRFDRLMGLATTHPLVEIKDCLEESGYEMELTARDVSRCMRASTAQVRPFLMKLASMGFMSYDLETDNVVIKERMLDYIAYKSEKKDYDVIEIKSNIAGEANATLSVLNNSFDLTIRGITVIILSDSHRVAIRPSGGQVVMKKNRDFSFNGIVHAGKFNFFGSNYDFLYDDFMVNMPNVDSVQLMVDVNEKDDRGRPIRKRVKTVLEYVSGELLIDNPGNKSGLQQLDEYPIFKSLKESYAFYNKREVQDGVYGRDNFYFQLEPYEFDSLDNFPNEKIRFKGNFSSAGIFPDFEEELTLQHDNSLGFVRATPPGGFSVFGGKGNFENTIKLSHDGLRGDGVLEYLNSTSASNDYLFFPTEVNGIAQSLVMDEQFGDPEYPPAVGTEVSEHWEPFNDLMQIETLENPLEMYDGSTLDGTVWLEPEALTGKGLFSFEQAELESELYRFGFSEFFSDTADFRLKGETDDLNDLQFSTVNVNAHIDFKERKGIFASNGGGSFVDFPANQYIAFMDQFTWFMDDYALELSAGKTTVSGAAGGNELQFEGSRFISTHPDQDSLDFYSSAARYDLKTKIIEARNVEFVAIADAFIYPSDGKITVQKKAKMETLLSAKIVANNITKYHTIDSADVDVFAKRDYSGSGFYTYKDVGGKEQRIKFVSIRVDSLNQTFASGFILEESGFTLSPHFAFKGDVVLHAAKKQLEFKGTTRISHECETLVRPWIKFTAEVDPEEIYIPISSDPQDSQSSKLKASIMHNSDSIGIYSTFLSPAIKPTDVEVLPVEGFLFYDAADKEYQISNINKLTEFSLPGNYMSLNTNTCKVYSEGKMDFGAKLGRLEVEPVGSLIHDTKDNSVVMDMIVLIDFFFENNALDKMAKQFTERTDLDGVDFDRDAFKKGIGELLEAKEADQLITNTQLRQNFKKVPDGLDKSFFLTDVKMRYDYNSGSYKSVGGEIGVGNILKKEVHKMVTGRMEVEKRRGGDRFNLYLELDSKTWYFFSYQRGLMQAISSDEEFNGIITGVKPDKRKMKKEKGKDAFSFMLSTKRKKSDFLKKF